MKIRDYRDLTVWQKSMDLAEGIYRVTRTFPASEVYGLSSQVRKAAVFHRVQRRRGTRLTVNR